MKISNDRMKKWFMVAGGLLICAVLVFMISSQFRKEPLEEVVLPSGEDIVNDVIVEKDNEINIDKGSMVKIDDGTVTNTEREESDEEGINVPPIKVSDTQNNKNGVDKGTNQTIQADIKKPKEPTKEELTDPTKKPNGERVEEPPKNVDHDKVEKPEETPKKKDESQGGDKNNKGQTYLPGFGWVENSGENQGTKAEDMYENGNKIGNMD